MQPNMLPGDPGVAPEPPATPEETPLAPDPDAPVETDAPTAGPEDDPMLALPDQAGLELPGEEELAEAAPEPEPEPEPEPAAVSEPEPASSRHRAPAVQGWAPPSPMDPALRLDTPAAGPVPALLMKSLPVVRTAQRAPASLPVALGSPLSSSAPLNRRGPVAASMVLICASLAGHAVLAWRRRTLHYWAV